MKQGIVIIGLGEMGSVFARGLLRLGHPMYPINRQTDMNSAVNEIPEPLLVLVAVGESDLHPVLEKMPPQWQNRLVLLQNELLPRDWQQYAWSKETPPTVISVWFEKKKGQDSKVLIASPIYGRHAQVIHDALATLEIPVQVLESSDQLELELVIKNVYILTTNIAGLTIEAGATVETLWQQYQQLAKDVISDVIDIQENLTCKTYNREILIDGMIKAMQGDLEHKCMGRSAPARLERAIMLADDAALKIPTLKKIKSKV